MSSSDYRKKIQDNIKNNIDEHGISLILSDGDFGYSVGAKFSGLPDLYMSNVNKYSAMHLINDIYQEMLNNVITEPCYIDGFLRNGYRIAVVEVSKTFDVFLKTDTMNLATEFYNGFDYTVYQVLVSDESGYFPWDKNYNEILIDTQNLYFHDFKLENLPTVNLKESL